MTEGQGIIEAGLGHWLADLGSTDAAMGLLATVEEILASGSTADTPDAVWHRYLDETRRTVFLQALPDDEARNRWAETTFPLIRSTEYGFETLLDQRVREHPDRTLFQEMEAGDSLRWSYEVIARRIRTMAAVFWAAHPEQPRVAIVSENTLDGACCDLACLAYDILVTPLSPHFNPETLAWIFDELKINIVVVETEELRDRMGQVRSLASASFRVFLLDPDAETPGEGESRLAEEMAQMGPAEADRILGGRTRRSVMDLATVMFTSGSTGRPKGVQYTVYNLITKRFARAAALPKVGDGEILFCFLPLYHTFGRYLEMTGMLFWGGTYVFAGNPSLETLLKGLQEVRPTGLISIPRRWQQIRDRCLAEMDREEDRSRRDHAFRRVVGDRLRWGLSAAGALEPAAFHFFQRHGVELCSGFGMTEATGGITMTQPGAYEDNTVGVPLPGLEARLSPEGELEIRGHYVARYLGDPPPSPDDEYWLSTGDIFRQRESGYYEIVDRIKDIYKNANGQTVAPGAIEQKLTHVPGIARSFLVGDGREYNVLLIVPDLTDPVLSDGPESERTLEYFQQVVTTANQGLAPFERVVNFALLDRDFERERGELTPKGSFQRKTIEENFQDVIRGLYRTNYVELEVNGLKVRIPRWFFRDLGILETDIVAQEEGLWNRRSHGFLAVALHSNGGTVAVGDLEYRVEGGLVDLGVFARQPMLWVANPSLIAFCPCKEGWDLTLKAVSTQVFIPWRQEGDYTPKVTVTPTSIRDPGLTEVNRLCTTALFTPAPDALRTVRTLEGLLKKTNVRLSRVIHRRLEALARHPDLEVRALAYRVFLLVGPVPDYTLEIPAFLSSGLPFLSEGSIEAIADARIEPVRLEALRGRLHRYRVQLEWPASEALRHQMEGVFSLLTTFVRHHPDYYVQIRAELVSWVLHLADPELSRIAREYLEEIVEWFEEYLEGRTTNNEPHRWEGKIVFHDRISEAEVRVIHRALVGTTFLNQSIMLAFDHRGIEVDEIPANGIWIAPVFSFLQAQVYRVSVNTRAGKHYDLLLGTATDREEANLLETTFWMLALGGRVDAPPVVRPFGCYRPDLGSFSMALVNDLTVWERVRALTGETYLKFQPTPKHWRDLFVRGIATFFRGWKHSDRSIVPGPLSPSNVMVPAPDFRSGGTILSLADWWPYDGPLSLVRPIMKNFFFPTTSYYPQTRSDLDVCWLFDGVMEALGSEDGRSFLVELQAALEQDSEPDLDPDWRLRERLEGYLKKLDHEYRVPLALLCAVERYADWARTNPRATPFARERQITELHQLYQLDAYGDMGRYALYRKTYFAALGPDVAGAFDRLLQRMFRNLGQKPTHMVELSELQATLKEDADRLVFSHMVFPASRRAGIVDILAVGGQGRGKVVVTSHVRDNQGERYTAREPIDPAEIGRLYRLYLESGMPLSLSDQARYLLAIDSDERIVAGISYKFLEPTIAYLDGLVVALPLRGNGLGGEFLEDFCLRLVSQGVRALNTHFIARPFLLAHGFRVDQEWGGLVRFLDPGSEVGGGVG